VTGTSIAADSQGKLHVAWASAGGLWYASNASGGFQAEAVTLGSATAISMAVDDAGTPWIAYRLSGGLQVATPQGTRWSSTLVGSAPVCTNCSTGIGIGADGNPIVGYSDGSSALAATFDGTSWTTRTIEGGGGQGMSLAVDKDGSPHASYYKGGEVHEAQSVKGAAWQVTEVGTVDAGSADAAGAGTSIGVDDQGVTYVAYYDKGFPGIRLASNGGGTFAEVTTSDTRGGTMPAVAVTPDGSDAFVTWYDTVNQNLELATYGEITGLSLAKASPTPTTTATASAPSATCQPSGTSLQITAENTAFSTSCLAVAAGQKFTITLDNKDPFAHNISLYTDSSATTPIQAQPLDASFVSASKTYDFNPISKPSNTYFFRCDFHPTQMFGTFVVAKK